MGASVPRAGGGPRVWLREALVAGRGPEWAAGIAVPAFDVVPPAAPRPGGISALAALRPTLSALWILRC